MAEDLQLSYETQDLEDVEQAALHAVQREEQRSAIKDMRG